MTSFQLNDKCADILDELQLLMRRFDDLRNQSSDEAWDDASVARPILDKLCDIEYEIELALKAVQV